MLKKPFYDHPLVHVFFVSTERTFCASVNGLGIGNAGDVDLTESEWGDALCKSLLSCLALL